MNRAFRIIGIVFSIVGGAMAVPAGLLLGLHFSGRGGEAALIASGVLGLLGVIFLALGTGFLVAVLVRKRRSEALLATGEVVRAKITGTAQNFSVQVNGRCPYRVLCRYTDGDGTVHEYHSDDIDFDPAGLFLSDEVDVYRDRYRPSRYYVDLARVLPPVVIH